MGLYTAFVEESTGEGTMWISAVTADNVSHAIEVAAAQCCEEWDYMTDGKPDLDLVCVRGIAEGDVALAYWDD